MTTLEIDQFFAEGRDLFLHRNFKALSRRFCYPLPLYYGNELSVFLNPSQMVRALDLCHQAICNLGVTRIATRVVGPISGDGRLKMVTVSIAYLDDNGRVVVSACPRYVLGPQLDSNTPKIELIEHQQVALPEVHDKLSAVFPK